MGAEQAARFARALSRLLGSIYTLSWSASFYPQLILNWNRKSTIGLSIDYPAINFIGFACYAISNAAFLYSPLIKEQYAVRHRLSPEPTVQFNDLAFAVHAVVLTALTYTQFFPGLWGFTVGEHQRVSRPIAGIFCGSVLAILLISVVVVSRGKDGGGAARGWAWIDVIYSVGYVKLVVTFVKYVPQARFNYKRKSTIGWSIGQILFDVTGGVLSLLQLIIDSSSQGDWSGITGNPVKLGLSNVSVFFDLIFITQHYILYRGRRGSRNNKDDDAPLNGPSERLSYRVEERTTRWTAGNANSR